jgi:hypothetical protein
MLVGREKSNECSELCAYWFTAASRNNSVAFFHLELLVLLFLLLPLAL